MSYVEVETRLVMLTLFAFCCFVPVELSAVTEDNKVLKQRIQILESELKK